ncbi:MAG: amidohydrolase family protein [Gemmatimonadota bacterium]|nr:amidohydrolase family protein [Gemmatimonadota bacterium]
MRITRSAVTIAFGFCLLFPALAVAQGGRTIPAPDRAAGEGEGPFERLIIRGAILIDGTGAPPTGPVDIVIERNRIAEIRNVGFPGVPIDSSRRPRNATREIDATGQYVMPGLIDLHVHAGGPPKNAELSYAYKLWLGHGITTVRGVGLTGFEMAKSEQARSASNAIVAPRIVNYQGPGGGWDKGPIRTPELAREWVRWAAKEGIDGIKFNSFDPEIMTALLDEAKLQKLGSTAHLGQMGVGRMNAIESARLGLGAMTHFYGLFESLYKDASIQPWPVDFNYQNEQHRFGQVARQWNMIHPRGSEPWNALIKEFLSLNFIIDPTMTIYHAGTNVMAARNADWHDTYTLPSMWDFYTPSREAHGSYWFDWTTADEVAWTKFYQVWMSFLNDYKNAGGRVTTGSDAGFIYKLYGFGLIEELELLQHAGFHPLEVVRAATLHGAEAIFEPKGIPIEYGIVRPGLLADLIIVDQNPLQNFKVLYGTGAVRLNEQTGKPERVGGVRYTIKDGIVYDAKQLLADVAEMVRKQKVARGMAPNAPLVRY